MASDAFAPLESHNSKFETMDFKKAMVSVKWSKVKQYEVIRSLSKDDGYGNH